MTCTALAALHEGGFGKTNDNKPTTVLLFLLLLLLLLQVPPTMRRVCVCVASLSLLCVCGSATTNSLAVVQERASHHGVLNVAVHRVTSIQHSTDTPLGILGAALVGVVLGNDCHPAILCHL